MILSVVIPTHDKRDLLARCLAALRCQQPGTEDWQIVVVDDGSRDGTAAYLRELAAGEPRLRLVAPAANVGRAAARNLGWRAAEGRWVLFLDDDILAPPGLLAAHLEVLSADARLGTIGPAVTDPAIADGRHFHYLDTRGVARLPRGPAPARFFVTQNAAVPRAALLQIGGFDEGYSAYGFEDMDLGFRLEATGVRFEVLPAPVPLHLHHHSLAEYLAKKRVGGQRSLRRLAERHPDRLREMRLHLVIDPPGRPSSLVMRCFRRGLATAAGPAGAALAAYWPGRGTRPWAPWLFCRCMDMAVMGAYCQGIAASCRDNVNMAPHVPR